MQYFGFNKKIGLLKSFSFGTNLSGDGDGGGGQLALRASRLYNSLTRTTESSDSSMTLNRLIENDSPALVGAEE